MRKLNGKIDAIKALRELVSNSIPLDDEINNSGIKVNVHSGLITLNLPKPYVGLKEAKDFIEAVADCCSEIKSVQPTMFWKLVKISVMGGKVSIPENLIGFYLTEQKAIEAMNGIMRLKGYNDVWENNSDFIITCCYFG